MHFFEFESIHLGIHTSDNSKQLSNIYSISIFKKTYHDQLAKLLFHVGRHRKGDQPPGRQLTVASIAGRAAALYCRYGLVVASGGGGMQGEMYPITR